MSIFFILKSVKNLLHKNELIGFAIMAIMLVFSGLFEVIGIASIVPYFNLISNHNYYGAIPFVTEALESSNSPTFLLTTLMITINLFSLVLKVRANYMMYHYLFRLEVSLSGNLFNSVMTAPFLLVKKVHTSEILKTIVQDTREIIARIIMPISTIFSALSFTLILISSMILIDWKITIVICSALIVLYLGLNLSLRSMLLDLSKIKNNGNIEKSRVIIESLRTYKGLIISGNSHMVVERYNSKAMEVGRAEITTHSYGKLPKYFLEFLLVIAAVVIFHISADTTNYLEDNLPVITFIAFGVVKLLPAFQTIYNGLVNMKSSNEVLKRFQEFRTTFTKEAGLDAVKYDYSLLKEQILVDIKSMTYSYEKSTSPLLKNINFLLKEGDRVGLIGSTGTGKSTFVELFMGLLTPTNGSITYNSQHFQNGAERSISYVEQEVTLLEGSLLQNIVFSISEVENFDSVNFERAISTACLEELYDSKGFTNNTLITENGGNLSGGQKQRIGIARALYKMPKILILDEATSALDIATENSFIERLNMNYPEITMIFIAHKLESLRYANRIIELDGKGNLIEKSSYNES